VADAWRSGTLRISRNALQWPLLGLFITGLIQLLHLDMSGGGDTSGNALGVAHSLSLDPYATRFALIQISSLLIYFAATLAFTDSPRRLRLLVRTIIIFGFLLALYSLIQFFVSPDKIYGIRQPQQSIPFGPFINRHHFAGYMELTLALPLGLLFSGAVEKDRSLLYAFAAAIMGMALVMTGSRGGMLSFASEVLFLVGVWGVGGRSDRELKDAGKGNTLVRAAAARAALGVALVLALFTGVLFFGGEESLSRLVGTVGSADPTSGRLQFWRGTLAVIRHHPLIGAGLGAFSAAYPQYDTMNGALRLEQAHNDYLQIIADGGIIGGALGLLFIIALFRNSFARAEATDKYRRGVARGALAGCFAALVHSFFDFPLHITSIALLFLVLSALATLNGRVEEPSVRRRRRRHYHGQDDLSEPVELSPIRDQESAAAVTAASESH